MGNTERPILFYTSDSLLCALTLDAWPRTVYLHVNPSKLLKTNMISAIVNFKDGG
jgi:hypothetical protein